ncbi:MAG: hypothetical protein K2X35_00885 [Bryobacteraceae bacterium]|nr:hypothetical protein [Bryobacteraceae bacterium]
MDTNVPVVANRKDSESVVCAAACATALNAIKNSGVLVLDEAGLILLEYRKYLSYSGQPGAGDAFFKWVTDNRYRTDRVQAVHLRPDPAVPGGLAAFPNDPKLAQFDRSDRKFVAVAMTHPERPPILNAIDSDWWVFRSPLLVHGIEVHFLCGESRFSTER